MENTLRRTGPILIVFLIFLITFLLVAILTNEPEIIGGETDNHNCLIAAGYSWNETDQRCVKEWEKQYCSEEMREAEVCIEIYNPVCGFPLEETFSNSCFACLNNQIDYYISGEC